MVMTKPTEPDSTAVFSGARLDRLRIRHLRLLELIAATGSLTAAAGALRISQPATTKMLQELERAFGCSLVERTTRGGVLSLSGERALERLKIVLGLLDTAGETLAAQPDTPLVRLGVLRMAGVELVPDMVAALRATQQLPQLRLYEGSASELLDMLNDGAVDCVIGRLEAGSIKKNVDAYDITPLTDEHYEVACAPTHALAGQRRVSLAALLDYPWVIPPRITYTHKVFEAAFLNRGMPPPIPQIESPSFHDSFAILARTDFLSMAPRSAVAYYAGLGRVHRVDLAQPFPVDYVVFISLKSVSTLPAVKLIRQALMQRTQTLP